MSKPKILVIDDDGLVNQTVKNLLIRKGYEPKICENGKTALNLMAQQDFDLILCDIRMPGLNGLETIKQIRRLLKTQNRRETPAFFFTGYADDKAYQEAQAMSEVLLKPYDIHELIKLIEKHLKEKAE